MNFLTILGWYGFYILADNPGIEPVPYAILRVQSTVIPCNYGAGIFIELTYLQNQKLSVG